MQHNPINMSTVKHTERDVSLDAVCGLFICYMIVNHASQYAHINNDTLFVFMRRLFFMFMPWFFYKSGMFMKDVSNIKDFVIKDLKKLIVPYILYNLIGEIVRYIDLFFFEKDYDWQHYILYSAKIVIHGGAPGNLPMWFLLTLFTTRSISAICSKYMNSKYKQWGIIVVCFIIAFIGNITYGLIKIPFVIYNTALAIIFYQVGYLLKNRQFQKQYIIGALGIFCGTVLFYPSAVDFHYDQTMWGSWGLYIISSIAGCILFNNIFKLQIFQIPFLVSIGRDSMHYFSIHWILFNIVWLLKNFSNTPRPSYYIFWTLCLFAFLALPILTHIINVYNNIKKTKFNCK